MSDDTCRVCDNQIEPGDAVIQVYDIVEVGEEKRYQQLVSEGGPHVHLSCIGK